MQTIGSNSMKWDYFDGETAGRNKEAKISRRENYEYIGFLNEFLLSDCLT